MTTRNLLAASVAAALSIGSIQSAEAAYAYAYQEISNFGVTGAALTAASIITTVFDSSSASSRHDAPPMSDTDNSDAAFSGSGVVKPNNFQFGGAQIGMVGDYGAGDSAILNTNFLAGTGWAWNAAEAYAPGGEGAPFNHGGSGSTSLSVQFTAAAASTLTFTYDFLVNYIAEVALPGSLPPGTQAIAKIGFSISIFDADNNTLLDGFAPIVQNQTFSSDITDTPRSFSASGVGRTWQSLALTQGTRYRIEVSTTELAQASQYAVPVPATLALMGLGLIGLGAARRRQSA